MTVCMIMNRTVVNMSMKTAIGIDSYSTEMRVVSVETVDENTRGKDRSTVRCRALALPAQWSTTLLRLPALKQWTGSARRRVNTLLWTPPSAFRLMAMTSYRYS